MSISIGDALLKVGINTGDMQRGLNNLGNQIRQHQKAIGIGMVAMGGTILAAGALSVKKFAEMGDEVQKMALRTGFSTEALSEFRHAAEISGASLGDLEKAVKRMAGTILDADDGLETYIRSFQHIGLEVEDLIGLKPEEQFGKILEAIADLEDPTMRAAIAQDIFGRAGTTLLPIMESGAEGLRNLREEAHKLGIVFDQDMADSAAEITDAMQRMGEAVSGVKMVIAENLIPILLPLINKIKDIIVAMGDWMKSHPELSRAIILITGGIGLLSIALGTLLLLLPHLISGITVLSGLFTTTAGTAGTLTLGIGALTAGFGLLGVAIGGAMMAFGGYLLYVNSQIDDYNEKVAEIFAKFNELNVEILSGAKDYNQEWRTAAGEVLAVYEQSKNLTDENIKQWEHLKKQVRTYDMLNQLAYAAEEGAKEINRLKEEEALLEEERLIKAKEEQIALQDELNRKNLQLVNVLHQQMQSMNEALGIYNAYIGGGSLEGGGDNADLLRRLEYYPEEIIARYKRMFGDMWTRAITGYGLGMGEIVLPEEVRRLWEDRGLGGQVTPYSSGQYAGDYLNRTGEIHVHMEIGEREIAEAIIDPLGAMLLERQQLEGG